jgi:hypothetical protein
MFALKRSRCATSGNIFAISRRFARAALEPLGYVVNPGTIEDSERRLVPCLARVADADGFDRVLNARHGL